MMKNSVRLTLVALLFYLLQSLLCGIMIGTFCMNAVWAELSSAVVVVVILLLIMRKKEVLSYYGICTGQWAHFMKNQFFLLLVPLVNLPYLYKADFSSTELHIGFSLIHSLFVGIMEELIFRSFLCRSIEQQSNEQKAVLVSSMIFGAFHLLNIGNIPFAFVLLQVLYAFAAGVSFAVVFYKTKSILFCMMVHTLVDFLGSFEVQPIWEAEVLGTVVCCACAGYAYFFVHNPRQRSEDCA